MGKTVILTEKEFNRIKKEFKPSKYMFNCNIRRFLNVLLSDPVNAKVPECVSMAGISKHELIEMMKHIGILSYTERLSDKNDDGTFKDKATMKVKYTLKDKVSDEEEYRIPKNKFDEKVEKLRIMIFEKNVPEGVNEDVLEEEGGGAASCSMTSGANTISMPLFGIMRRAPKTKSDE